MIFSDIDDSDILMLVMMLNEYEIQSQPIILIPPQFAYVPPQFAYVPPHVDCIPTIPVF